MWLAASAGRPAPARGLSSTDARVLSELPCRLPMPELRRLLHGRMDDSDRTGACHRPSERGLALDGGARNSCLGIDQDPATRRCSRWRRRHAGACVFYDTDHDRLCSIQRDAGIELMPSACRNFPRVTLRDRARGIHHALALLSNGRRPSSACGRHRRDPRARRRSRSTERSRVWTPPASCRRYFGRAC